MSTGKLTSTKRLSNKSRNTNLLRHRRSFRLSRPKSTNTSKSAHASNVIKSTKNGRIVAKKLSLKCLMKRKLFFVHRLKRRHMNARNSGRTSLLYLDHLLTTSAFLRLSKKLLSKRCLHVLRKTALLKRLNTRKTMKSTLNWSKLRLTEALNHFASAKSRNLKVQ